MGDRGLKFRQAGTVSKGTSSFLFRKKGGGRRCPREERETADEASPTKGSGSLSPRKKTRAVLNGKDAKIKTFPMLGEGLGDKGDECSRAPRETFLKGNRGSISVTKKKRYWKIVIKRNLYTDEGYGIEERRRVGKGKGYIRRPEKGSGEFWTLEGAGGD